MTPEAKAMAEEMNQITCCVQVALCQWNCSHGFTVNAWQENWASRKEKIRQTSKLSDDGCLVPKRAVAFSWARDHHIFTVGVENSNNLDQRVRKQQNYESIQLTWEQQVLWWQRRSCEEHTKASWKETIMISWCLSEDAILYSRSRNVKSAGKKGSPRRSQVESFDSSLVRAGNNATHATSRRNCNEMTLSRDGEEARQGW